MKFIPLLLKPTVLGFRNRWSSTHRSNYERGRDAVLLSFSILMFIGIFQLTLWSLGQMGEMPALATLPTLQPLAVALMLLSFMLLTSNLAAALVLMYLSKDLDCIVASPLSVSRLFFNKFLHVCIVSSWMPFLFLIPLLLAFGYNFGSGLEFYVAIPFVLIPYMMIPTALGILAATLISIVLPARRTAMARFIFVCIAIAVGTSIIYLLKTAFSAITSPTEVTRMIRVFTLPSTNWIPSRWAASLFDNLINRSQHSVWTELSLLYSTALWTSCLAYISVELFYPLAYSNTQVEPDGKTNHSPSFDRLCKRLVAPLSRPYRAMLLKEFKSVIRDVSHLFEVIMLGGMCGIYLLNLQSFTVLDNVPVAHRNSWIATIFLLNIAMNAFVITALCTRFVFPSMSREGSAYWIVATAPISRRTLLLTKRTCWLIPVSFMGVGFVLLSTILLKLPITLVIITCCSSFLICYGVVSGAVGLGSAFALTDAEHPSQVTGGIGSFLFMLFACLLIFVNLMPVWILSVYSKLGDERSNPYVIVLGGVVTLIAIAVMNHLAAVWALKQGENALARQMN
jgi:ABC-2 type transport system permease protein